MPPKRKAPEASTEPSTSTRATRSSAHTSTNGDTSNSKTQKSATTTKSTSRSKKVAKDEELPPAKKAKTTKGKATAKTARSKKGQNPNDSEDDQISVPNKKSKEPTVPTATSSASSTPVASSTSAKKSDIYTPAGSLQIFQQYCDEDDPDVIGPEGLEKLFNDAGISVEGAMPMILAWQLQASEMMKVTKEEWVRGTAGLKISSLPVLQKALSDLDELLIYGKSPKTAKTNTKDTYDKTAYRSYASDTKTAFQKFYLFCFNLIKPEQSRNIEMEMASALWTVLLVPKYPVMKEVLEFIQEKGSYKAVNKDLWSMMLEFCITVRPDLSNYEADGAWPTLLDDFAASRNVSASATTTSE